MSDETVDLLASVPLFAYLDEHERATLNKMLEVSRFDKGDTIFHYGDTGDALYIVQEGRVEIYIENTEGDKIVVGENEAGDLFGEVSLLDGGPRTASAVAVDATTCLMFDRDALLEFVRLQPHAALDLLTVMGRRLRSTDELLRTRVTRNLNDEEEEMLTFGQRIADKVATFGGSWTFIITFGAFLAVWMGINVWLALRAWDVYPFILLNLILSTLAALQAPVIMMSQNRQATKDRLKADIEYQINLKAELEVAQLHSKVDRIYESLDARFHSLERHLGISRNANKTGVFDAFRENNNNNNAGANPVPAETAADQSAAGK